MRQATRRQHAGWSVLTAGLILAAAAAGTRAATSNQDTQTVAVTILGIHATNEEKPHIDPALAAIAKPLKRYKFALGKEWELPMVEGYARRVRPTESDKDRVKMEVAWIQYVKDKDGKRKAHVRERHIMFIGKGKYLLTAVKLKKGALVGAVAVK